MTSFSRYRVQRLEPAFSVGAQPSPERLHRVASGRVRVRRSEAAAAELFELVGQLTAIQIAVEHGAEHLRAKQRDALGVVFGTQ